MRTYELTFVLDPRLPDEETQALCDEYQRMIEGAGGRIEHREDWGKRQLAYPIGKLEEGRYLLWHLSCDNGNPTREAEHRMRQREEVLRFLTVRTEALSFEPDDEEPAEERDAAEAPASQAPAPEAQAPEPPSAEPPGPEPPSAEPPGPEPPSPEPPSPEPPSPEPLSPEPLSPEAPGPEAPSPEPADAAAEVPETPQADAGSPPADEPEPGADASATESEEVER